MFSETSIIKEVNIVNKLVCYILVLFCIFWVQDPVFVTFSSIIFLLLTKENKKIFIVNVLITVFTVTTIFNPQLLWISKFLILCLYTVLLKTVTEIRDLRYVLEKTLYKINQRKLTSKFFYMMYFCKNYKQNFNKMLLLSDDYGIKLSPKFIIFTIRQSYNKTKLEKEKFIETNTLRFYNYTSTRTYVDKLTWERWDNTYLVCYIIIVMISIVYGR